MNRINNAKDIMMDLYGAGTEDGSRRAKGSGIWSRKSFRKEKSENLKVMTNCTLKQTKRRGNDYLYLTMVSTRDHQKALYFPGQKMKARWKRVSNK